MSKPKPIIDPHAGQYQVVVSFRLDLGGDRAFLNPTGSTALDLAGHFLRPFWYGLHIRPAWKVHDLDVAVREIGAGGETSQDEGRYDHPAALANLDDVEHVRPTRDVDPGSRL